MLTGQGQLGGTTSTKYFLYVIGADGRILRSASAGIQSAGWHLPRFSVAGRSVYFLDGDRDLKVLREDGSVALVGQLPGGPADRVVFAVSPDEQQIGYSVLHYTGSTATTSLRVGRLDGSGVREIYSGSVVEYPIGWHSGELVIALTRYAIIQNPGEVNPYFADAYHIANASSATRTFSTSPTCDQPSSLQGPPVNAAGSVCQQNSGNTQIFLVLGWDGSKREIFRSIVDGNANAVPPAVLNPDGQSAAAGIAADHRISLLSGGTAKATAATGTPAGWFDDDHLLFMTGPCCQPLTSAAILDIAANSTTPVASGLTGSADPYAPFFSPIPSSLV